MTGKMVAAAVTQMIRMCFSVHHVIGELPTYGYRRVWALLRRQAELDGTPAINAKRVYRIMRQNALLLERKPLYRHRNGHILAKWP